LFYNLIIFFRNAEERIEGFTELPLSVNRDPFITFFADDRLYEGQDFIESLGNLFYINSETIYETPSWIYLKAASYGIMLVAKIAHFYLTIASVGYTFIDERAKLVNQTNQKWFEQTWNQGSLN